METLEFVKKEEAEDNECCEAKSDFYSTFETEQTYDVRLENGQGYHGASGTWKFVKEESGDHESHEAKPDIYSFFDSKQTCGVKIENGQGYHGASGTWKFVKEEPGDNESHEARPDIYSMFDSEQTCEVKIENGQGFVKTEDKDQDYSKTTSYYPKLSVSLVRLEYSKNQEVMKYLKPLLPAITSTIDLKSENNNTELNMDLKAESVELETLTENTIVQSPRNYRYASPWDFVSVTSPYDPNSLPKSGVKTEFEDNDVSENLTEKGFNDGTYDELFTRESPSPRTLSDIENTRASKEKFIEETLNMDLKTESVELETLTENTLVQFPNEYRYASPWDFVSVTSTCGQSSLTKDTVQMESENNNLAGNVIKKECENRNCIELFTCNFSSPEQASGIQSTKVVRKKFVQQTLNFDSLFEKRFKNRKSLTDRDVADVGQHKPRSSGSDIFRDKSYSCKVCNESFERKSNLTRHMHNKHGEVYENVNKFTCDICGRPSPDMSLLRRHRATHDPTKRYKCDVCGKEFKLKHYLCQHLQSHNSNRYPCNHCSRLYSRPSTLRRHIRAHKEGVTKFRNNNKRAPETKDENVHKPTVAKILKCTKQTAKKDDEAVGEASLGAYECDVCGKRFETKSRMKVHIEFLHIEIFSEDTNKLGSESLNSSSNKPTRSAKSSLKKRYQCHICNKRYTQSSHLYRHQESHRTTKTHICKLCNQSFSTTSSLSRHMLNKHDEVNLTRRKPTKIREKSGKNYKCKICGQVLGTLGDLRRHCATHDGRKPYECDICKKQFAVKGYLYAHILTHNNWKPYPCESCPKFYRRKSSLQRHIDIRHSEEKKYECGICKKSFKHESTYRIHMGRFHQGSTSND